MKQPLLKPRRILARTAAHTNHAQLAGLGLVADGTVNHGEIDLKREEIKPGEPANASWYWPKCRWWSEIQSSAFHR
ncbi:MAG: hypothetical protein ACOYMG_04505 [Candidatus Methylumidiphilus sp.]